MPIDNFTWIPITSREYCQRLNAAPPALLVIETGVFQPGGAPDVEGRREIYRKVPGGYVKGSRPVTSEERDELFESNS